MAEFDPGLFALPPGVDFARSLVDGLLVRFKDKPPEALAQVTLWLNSGRTLMAVREAFDARGPLLLPRMNIISDLGMDKGAAVVSPLARQMQLAQLIAGLMAARPELGLGQSIPELARSLADLMTEMQTEGRGLQALDAIDAGDHARHWQNALAFLRIAAGFHLSPDAPDRAARQRRAAESVLAAWQAGQDLPTAPVIVAGSTGSHGATRMFMQAVAAMPNGAVVLPGYDFDQPDTVWQGLESDGEDHPQARFAPLRATMPVQRWLDQNAPCPARNRLVSLALRPAPVTDQWISDGPLLGDLLPATADLTLIEAAQPGQEAEAIAALIRSEVAKEHPITLIAADRGLTRRVASALDKWHIVPDDSAGRPLPLSAPGLFLRQIAALPGQRLTPDKLLILLKHPLTATGSPLLARRSALLLARELELDIRRNGPAFPDGASLRAWADRAPQADAPIYAEWLADVLDKIEPWARDRDPRPIADRLGDLRGLAETLAAGPGGDAETSELWQHEAGEKTRAVLEHLAQHAAAGPPMRPRDLAELVFAELQAQALRRDPAAHPLVRFRGPREARTAAHGTVILAGLNEGSWPVALAPDPWLSRQMRVAAGLTLPERRIGLSAHDFQQGIAAERVILTRAARDAEAETIPSRWLNRLTNLMEGLPDQNGAAALAAMRDRGRVWLDLADAMGRPVAPMPPAPRPAPIPPGPAFDQLSVTDIATLIRDPYAIYARKVLRLRPLDPLRSEPDAALRGQVLHRIVERFLLTRPDADTPVDELRRRFLQATAAILDSDVPWPSARIFWQARMQSIADRIAEDEQRRLALGAPVVIENGGGVSVPGLKFRLIARPDRIDRLADGTAHVYDYKSGTPPTSKQMESFEKQLPLEAAMAQRGGFAALGAIPVSGISYIQLGGEGKTHGRELSDTLIGETWDRMVDMIRSYLTGGAGFVSLRAPMDRDHAGDFAHLARFGEWSLADPVIPREVGDHDG